MAQCPVVNEKLKHIEVKHHFLKVHLEKRNCILQFLSTQDIVAEIFTKPLPRIKLHKFTVQKGLELRKGWIREEVLWEKSMNDIDAV